MDATRAGARKRFLEWLRRCNRRVTNPITLTFAGRRWFAVVHHIGRRSGQKYRTPVLAAPYEDGFVIPLTYGDHVDWCRNVLAAGQCTIMWRGEYFEVIEPEIVEANDALAAFSRPVQLMLRRNEVAHLLRLRSVKKRNNQGDAASGSRD